MCAQVVFHEYSIEKVAVVRDMGEMGANENGSQKRTIYEYEGGRTPKRHQQPNQLFEMILHQAVAARVITNCAHDCQGTV